jgi:hypothetical protein
MAVSCDRPLKEHKRRISRRKSLAMIKGRVKNFIEITNIIFNNVPLNNI